MSSKRVAVSVSFFIFGTVAGTLLPRLPAIKENLHLTDGDVGVAFLAFAVGAVASAAAGRFVLSGGARRPVRIGIFAMGVALAAPGFAPSYPLLVAAFLLNGLCAGIVDMLLNSQAAEIERDAGRPMINSFHAYWSVGSIAGSAAAAGAAAMAVPVAVQFSATAAFLALVSIPLTARVPDTRGGAAVLVAPDRGRWHLGAAVAVVAAIALVAVAVEGAGGDWSAIYLRDFGRAPEGVAALAFAAMSVAMTVVRFSADRLTALTSARAVIGLGGAVVAAGFALAVALPQPPPAIFAFALVGAGTAVLFPLAMSVSANLDEAGSTLSFVTAAGYAGSVFAPPLIGAAADRFGLRLALLIPAFLGFAVFGMMASTRVLSPGTKRGLTDATERVEPEA